MYVKDNEEGIIAEDAIYININILDLNDNRPEFLTSENPVEISVSSHLETGELIAKMEAWDSDLGINAELRYKLIVPENNGATSNDRNIFAINEISGDVTLRAPLVNQAGKTFRMIVEATDSAGGKAKDVQNSDSRGLTGTIQLVVYVLDSNYQLTMVLSSGVGEVTRDLLNITRALTSLTGYSIGTHNVEEHMSTLASNEVDGENPNAFNTVNQGSEPAGSIGSEGSTDLYIYAIDAKDGLVKTDEMISALMTKLPTAKSKLSRHGLLEVRAGAHTLTSPQDSSNGKSSTKTNSPSTDSSSNSDGSMGSLEIAVLGMACAVFFGALIAVVSIFCIKVKR